ncbi:unnamed protein product [Calypogeia fissa]
MMDDEIYKRSNVKAWKPQWKDKLKEICLQRVRKERSKLLWDIRLTNKHASATSHNDSVGSAFELIVADELQKVKYQNGVVQEPELKDGQVQGMEQKDGHDMIWEHETPDAPTELGDEEYEALMLAMEHALYEDMHAELEDRDAALVEEYETVHSLEDESLAAVVEHWQEHEEGGLLCPLCRTRRLQQSQRSIFCGCGRFQLDTQHEQVGLEFLQRRLAEVLQEHIDSGCRGQGTFSIQRRFGIGALYMQCSVCDCFQLVL